MVNKSKNASKKKKSHYIDKPATSHVPELKLTKRQFQLQTASTKSMITGDNKYWNRHLKKTMLPDGYQELMDKNVKQVAAKLGNGFWDGRKRTGYSPRILGSSASSVSQEARNRAIDAYNGRNQNSWFINKIVTFLAYVTGYALHFQKVLKGDYNENK